MRNSKKRSLSLSRNQGSILIVTMWVLVCFSILSVGLYGIVSSRIRLAEVIEGRITGEYLARAACVSFKINRSKNKTGFDTLSELNEKQERQLGRGKFKYTLKDEEAKLNINTASIDILEHLPGFDKEIAKKVFESKLKPFRTKEEMMLIDDVSQDLFDKCKDLITVYTEGDVNINTAGPEVLKILGLDEDLVALISEFRAGPDGKDSTGDDGIFENTAGIINKLRSASGLYEAQEAKLLQLISQNILSVASKNFTLEVETTFLERAAMRYNIVMDKDKIKRWTEF